MKLHYFWTDMPDGSHVAANYTIHLDGISGSVRLWSRDTRVNVGRKFAVATATSLATRRATRNFVSPARTARNSSSPSRRARGTR